jgi:aryl carrier-like protein
MIDKIGIDDNLFELGADSIQVFRIVARANRAGVALTAPQVLLRPTIAGVSATASVASESASRPRRPAITAVPRQGRILTTRTRVSELPG